MSLPLTRADFERLVAEHEEVIRLANELEYQLYCLGTAQDTQHVTECQQAGGALLARLRGLLFRHDQQILPLLEAGLADNPEEDNRTELHGQTQVLPSGERGHGQTR